MWCGHVVPARHRVARTLLNGEFDEHDGLRLDLDVQLEGAGIGYELITGGSEFTA